MKKYAQIILPILIYAIVLGLLSYFFEKKSIERSLRFVIFSGLFFGLLYYYYYYFEKYKARNLKNN